MGSPSMMMPDTLSVATKHLLSTLTFVQFIYFFISLSVSLFVVHSSNWLGSWFSLAKSSLDLSACTLEVLYLEIVLSRIRAPLSRLRVEVLITLAFVVAA